MTAIGYDSIGQRYIATRRTDARIAGVLHAALGEARTILNVGAGAGAYEPNDRDVIAVEPSAVMLAQRTSHAPSVRATAERLPFGNQSFDAVLGVLTLHHWSDQRDGLRQCRRVARDRVVFLTWDPASPAFWLEEYFPDLLALDRRIFPSLDMLQHALGPLEVHPVAVPFDCIDGFLGAFWRRPDAYLDDRIRAGMSFFSRIGSLDAGPAALRRDLDTGHWHSRHGDLLNREDLDVGYRVVVASAATRHT
jgi:SAM-dependent methyltransferase